MLQLSTTSWEKATVYVNVLIRRYGSSHVYKNNGLQTVRLRQLSHVLLIWKVAFKLVNKWTIIKKRNFLISTPQVVCVQPENT